MTTYVILALCSGTTDADIVCTVGEPLTLEFPCPGDEGSECRWELFGALWRNLAREELSTFRGEGACRVQVYQFTPRAPGEASFLAIHADGNDAPIASVNVHVTVKAKEATP